MKLAFFWSHDSYLIFCDDTLEITKTRSKYIEEPCIWKIQAHFLPFDSSNASPSDFDVLKTGYCLTEDAKLARHQNGEPKYLAYDSEKGFTDVETEILASITTILLPGGILFRTGDTMYLFTSEDYTRIYSYKRSVVRPPKFCKIHNTISYDGKPVKHGSLTRIAANNR